MAMGETWQRETTNKQIKRGDKTRDSHLLDAARQCSVRRHLFFRGQLWRMQRAWARACSRVVESRGGFSRIAAARCRLGRQRVQHGVQPAALLARSPQSRSRSLLRAALRMSSHTEPGGKKEVKKETGLALKYKKVRFPPSSPLSTHTHTHGQRFLPPPPPHLLAAARPRRPSRFPNGTRR